MNVDCTIISHYKQKLVTSVSMFPVIRNKKIFKNNNKYAFIQGKKHAKKEIQV